MTLFLYIKQQILSNNFYYTFICYTSKTAKSGLLLLCFMIIRKSWIIILDVFGGCHAPSAIKSSIFRHYQSILIFGGSKNAVAFLCPPLLVIFLIGDLVLTLIMHETCNI